MKTLYALAFFVTSCFTVFSQNESPIPRITQKLTDYFGFYPKENVYVITDKQIYKPGETIWFSAIVESDKASTLPDQELMVQLYNKEGESVAEDKFKLVYGYTPGDLQIPEDLTNDQYLLVAYISNHDDTNEIFCTTLNIDPAYSNQWVISVTAKDSISIAGQKNELYILLNALSGEVEKNTSLRYQLTNGKEIIEKGKLKTDAAGKAILPFTLPAKSNGEPFICELADNKGEWKKEVFLPSNLDLLVIRFYPEGGKIIVGVRSKIGFTAFNKWGIPVSIEGKLVNKEGKQVETVKTFTNGLGLFPIENDGSQKLKLVLSGKTGQNQTFDLPEPIPSGMSFSVTKTDPEFISANLVFADKQKHTIALVATNRGNIYWASDLDINGMGRIKIPTENLPQGMNQLSVFSNDRKLLAERLVFVDKKQRLKVEVLPDKSNLKQSENMKIKIRLTDENNQPVSGNVSVSIADSFRKAETSMQIEEYQLAGAELETPYDLISKAYSRQITNSALMDVFLIANREKDFDWQKVMQFKPENTSDSNNGNIGISGIVADKNMKNKLLNHDLIAESTYFKNNPDLFIRATKIVKPNTIARDNQQKMLSTATSLLDVIKTIKPYKLMNNQIVFVGSENSLNYQGGALIVLDGQQMGTDISSLQNISPMEVDHINVSTNPMDIQRYTGLNSVGIIEIFTKRAPELPVSIQKENTNQYDGGYRIPNVFPVEIPNPKRDYRTTLQWIPELIIDETGQAEISVTAGKVVSDFIIEVQGIDINGRIGGGKAGFKVVK